MPTRTHSELKLRDIPLHIDIQGEGAFETALIQIESGEEFFSESGAMYRATNNVDIDVTRRKRGGGTGLLAGAKRLLAGENFFYSRYATTDGQPGEVGLAPVHQGQLRVIEVDSSRDWMCAGGSYLANSAELEIDTQFQGMKGFLTGESLFFLKVTGYGSLLVSGFGRLVEMEVRDALTIDTGHLVAFESTLEYTVTKAAGSWFQSFLTGEGFVMNFTGSGRILTQSHNPREFGKRVGPLLPPRES